MLIMKKKTIQEFVIISILLFLYTIIAINKYLTYFGLFLFIIIFLIVTIKHVSNKSVFLPKLILILLLFQNTCIGIGAHIGGNYDSSIRLLTQIPTILVLISSIYIFITQPIGKRWLFVIYVLFVFSYLFRGDVHIESALVYIRNFFIFFLALIIGRNNLDLNKKRDEFIDFYIKIAMLGGIFGLIGIILGDEFFNMIGVREVYIGKNWSEIEIGQTPGNFRTIFMSIRVNRMASFYYEPVNFSYFICLATILAYFCRRKIVFVFLFICSILTFGKGGLFTVGLTVMAVSIHTIFKIRVTKANRRRIMVFMLLLFVSMVIYISTFQKSSFGTYNHFYGFFAAIPEIIKNPLGHGLGTAGNILRSYTYTETYMASESALATMGYQIGIIGLILFFVILYKSGTIAFGNIGTQVTQKHYVLCLSASYLPFALFLISAFQENTLSPQCIVPFMLLVGSYGRINVRKPDTVMVKDFNRANLQFAGKGETI